MILFYNFKFFLKEYIEQNQLKKKEISKKIEEESNFSSSNYSLVFPEIKNFANCPTTTKTAIEDANWQYLKIKIQFNLI